MAKSKKFKPVLKTSDIRCGVSYLQVFINDKGYPYLCSYKPTRDPRNMPCSWRKTGDILKVDYWSQSVGKSGPYHFKDSFVCDMVGVYGGYRQTSRFYDFTSSREVVLYNKGLFKFSNKLLEKLKSFKGDPIKVYEFLNPGRSLTGSEKDTVLFDIKRNELSSLQNKRSNQIYNEFIEINQQEIFYKL